MACLALHPSRIDVSAASATGRGAIGFGDCGQAVPRQRAAASWFAGQARWLWPPRRDGTRTLRWRAPGRRSRGGPTWPIRRGPGRRAIGGGAVGSGASGSGLTCTPPADQPRHPAIPGPAWTRVPPDLGAQRAVVDPRAADSSARPVKRAGRLCCPRALRTDQHHARPDHLRDPRHLRPDRLVRPWLRRGRRRDDVGEPAGGRMARRGPGPHPERADHRGRVRHRRGSAVPRHRPVGLLQPEPPRDRAAPIQRPCPLRRHRGRASSAS